MASVRTFTLPHYEAYPMHVALFRDVQNASYLRSQLLEANPAFDYAFLDASMVRDTQYDFPNWRVLNHGIGVLLLAHLIDFFDWTCYSTKEKGCFFPHIAAVTCSH
jgi:hypothetical protein